MRQHATGLWEKRRARGTDKWKAKGPYKKRTSEKDGAAPTAEKH
jgi:hypothetical protein